MKMLAPSTPIALTPKVHSGARVIMVTVETLTRHVKVKLLKGNERWIGMTRINEGKACSKRAILVIQFVGFILKFFNCIAFFYQFYQWLSDFKDLGTRVEILHTAGKTYKHKTV